MKNIAITIFIVLIVGVLVLYFISFQVRETEYALVTRFGKVSRSITEPGFKLMWPPPIERKHKFDARMRLLEIEYRETPTRGVDPITVSTYALWRIADPCQFFNSVGTLAKAEEHLRSQVNNARNNIIGRYAFSDFVNSDEEKIKINEIEDKMLASLKSSVLEDYGIEVEALGIRQLKVSEEVTKDVFERMRKERNRKSDAIIGEGNSEAAKIKSDADSKSTELLAAAEARAKAIRGEGDAEAAKYYEMLQEDPELAMFLRDLEALETFLSEKSTLVISADTAPFKLLKEKPELRAGETAK
jgi:membrane protease subunit HflC